MKYKNCKTVFLLLVVLLAAGCRGSTTSTTLPGTTPPTTTTRVTTPTPTSTPTPTGSPTVGPTTTTPPKPTPTTPAPTVTGVPPEQARSVVMALPAVQRWVAGHSGAAAARLLNGTYQVNNGGNWQAAAKTSYDQAIASPYTTAVTSQTGAWTVTLSSKYGFSPAQISVEVNAASAAVVSVTPDLDAELKGGVLATFDVKGQPLHVFVTNAATIDSLYKLQSGLSFARIPFGALKPGPGAGLSNSPWSWHMDPVDISMAELTAELYDATPQYVEDTLDTWLNTVKRYSPWSAKLVSIKDYR